MKKLFIIILLILSLCVLGLAGGLALITPPPVEAYSWKNSYIDKLEKEIESLERKIERLTFELGDRMPVPAVGLISERLDCDDATLYMYYWFKASGYKVDIIKGNLQRTNETWSDDNHVWLLVYSDNLTYPYDLGYYQPDDQHFEGHIISYKRLLYWVMDD